MQQQRDAELTEFQAHFNGIKFHKHTEIRLAMSKGGRVDTIIDGTKVRPPPPHDAAARKQLPRGTAARAGGVHARSPVARGLACACSGAAAPLPPQVAQRPRLCLRAVGVRVRWRGGDETAGACCTQRSAVPPPPPPQSGVTPRSPQHSTAQHVCLAHALGAMGIAVATSWAREPLACTRHPPAGVRRC